MKPFRFTDELLATRLSNMATVARRLSVIRGIAEDDDEDGAEKTNDAPEVVKSGEVRVIPVRGVLCRDCRGWFPWATDTEELEELIGAAEDDNNVSAIVLDIDSPGGSVNGTIELGELVAGIQKPIVTYVSGGCHSAAYWMAAASEAILIRRSASVGSVGVYSAILDWSVFYEQMGISVELLKSGEHKGAGYPGTSLTDAQKAVIQAEVDRLGVIFVDHVTTYRPEIHIESLDGQSFAGDSAVEAGMADEVVSGVSGAVKAALALAGM